ncbi:MAG: 4Fe-4S binding protein [Bacillota bacterium]|nr:4Fe-4S binding protein [Bacillota bacterium]
MHEKTRKQKKAIVEQALCVGCGCCQKICPKEAISIWKGMWALVDPDKCIGCGKCARECPASIIRIQEVS